MPREASLQTAETRPGRSWSLPLDRYETCDRKHGPGIARQGEHNFKQVGAEIPVDSEEGDEENKYDGKTLLYVFERGYGIRVHGQQILPGFKERWRLVKQRREA